MHFNKTFRWASLAAACGLLAACGGGGSDSASEASPLSENSAPAAASTAVAVGLDGTLIFNLRNQFPEPTATAQDGTPSVKQQSISLKQLVQILQNLPGAGNPATSDSVTAVTQTVACNGGGTYQSGAAGATYTLSYSNCTDNGVLYNGQVSVVYSTDQTVYVSAGNFSGFSMSTYPAAGETLTMGVNGDLSFAYTPATVDYKMSSNSLRITFTDSVSGQGSASGSISLLGFVQDMVYGGSSSDTLVTTQGRIVDFDPETSFDVTINNTAQNDLNQAIFHVLPTQNGPSPYPYAGSLFIKDNKSSATIVVSAINGNANYAMLSYTLPSLSWTDTQLWSDLYLSGP